MTPTPTPDTADIRKKPKATSETVLALRELVIELADQFLADRTDGAVLNEVDHARLLTRLAMVRKVGYPNKWSRANDADKARANNRQTHLSLGEVDPEDPGAQDGP